MRQIPLSPVFSLPELESICCLHHEQASEDIMSLLQRGINTQTN